MDKEWTLLCKSSVYHDKVTKPYIDAYLQHHMELCQCEPDALEREGTRSDLRHLTKLLFKYPRIPFRWCMRAKVLLKLGFPDLAIGDAYKAKCLLEDSNDQKEIPCIEESPSKKLASELAQLQVETTPNDDKKSAVLLIAQGLLVANAFSDCIAFVDAHRNWFPSSADRDCLQAAAKAAFKASKDQQDKEPDRSNTSGTTSHSDNDDQILSASSNEEDRDRKEAQLEEQEELYSGAIKTVAYPWLTSEFLRRSTETLVTVNDEMRRLAGAGIAQRRLCAVSKSSVRNRRSFRSALDNYTDVCGIFAIALIPKACVLFVDETPVCAVENPKERCTSCRRHLPRGGLRFRCCAALFCTRESCRVIAASSFHNATCQRDLSVFERPASVDYTRSAKSFADEQLLLRTLCCVLQHPDIHPLRGPLINRMTAQYGALKPQAFSLERDIIRPNQMLLRLGVDVYANHDFDTWVLQTIQARIRTNVRELVEDGRYFVALNPRYLFFNHSCDPNVAAEIDTADPQNVLTMRTLRAVNLGKELYISYLCDEQLELDVWGRRSILKDWLGGACQCPRCVEEEEAVLKREFVHY